MASAEAGTLGATASMCGTATLLTGSQGPGLVMAPPIDYFQMNTPNTDNWSGLAGARTRIAALPAASGSFDSNSNLRQTVDFRNVLSDLIGVMGCNPTPILGQTWPRLGFVRSPRSTRLTGSLSAGGNRRVPPGVVLL